MKSAYADVENTGSDWRETLNAAFDLGLSCPFNIEWLTHKADRGAWSGIWW